MFSQRPSRIEPRYSQPIFTLKNDCCTSAQPGVFTTVSHTSTASTMVLARLISTDRPDCLARNARRSSSIALTGVPSSLVCC